MTIDSKPEASGLLFPESYRRVPPWRRDGLNVAWASSLCSVGTVECPALALKSGHFQSVARSGLKA
jgi:hypothetical protein